MTLKELYRKEDVKPIEVEHSPSHARISHNTASRHADLANESGNLQFQLLARDFTLLFAVNVSAHLSGPVAAILTLRDGCDELRSVVLAVVALRSDSRVESLQLFQFRPESSSITLEEREPRSRNL